MRLRTALNLMVIVAFTVSSQTISLSGIVSNKSGKPLAGAIVTLAVQKISDTTDAQGAFSIKKSTSLAGPAPILPRAEKISFSNGILSLGLASSAPVKIELFDMKGNLLEKAIDRSSPAGDYRFDMKTRPLAANMMLIRVSTNRQTSAFRYLPMESIRLAVSSPITMSPAERGLTKTLATVDSLSVTASGYLPKTVAVSSYQSSVNVTLDSMTIGKFSFFVTSLKAVQEFSKSQNGFGGDLRFGKTGQGAGLLGADSICQCIAEKSLPGSKVKMWRAFLSVAKDENGKQVNAIDRIGKGPWYDRLGHLLAPTVADLLHTRPTNGDGTIKNDLPNENGIPNHRPDPTKGEEDNHHMITGSDTLGKFISTLKNCQDWTSVSAGGQPRCGFAWPRGGSGGGGGGGMMGAAHWISGFDAASCQAEVHVTTSMGGSGIGSNGGYGGFYCFALTP